MLIGVQNTNGAVQNNGGLPVEVGSQEKGMALVWDSYGVGMGSPGRWKIGPHSLSFTSSPLLAF